MLAFTFPGQGSQRSGMGHAWVEHPSWEVAAEASEIAGRDLTSLLLEAPMEELTQTANAQLATFVMSLVVLDAVERLGSVSGGVCRPQPGRVHRPGGLGRPLPVRRHPAWSSSAATPCRRPPTSGPGPWPPSSGSPTATPRRPASGPRTRCGWPTTTPPARWSSPAPWPGWPPATEKAKELGARKVLPIPVSGAFHTQLMLPARARLRQTLDAVEFHSPEVPVVANVDARVHTDPGRVARPALVPAVQPGAVAPDPGGPGRTGRHAHRRAGPRRRAHRHGPADHPRRAGGGGGRARPTWTS